MKAEITFRFGGGNGVGAEIPRVRKRRRKLAILRIGRKTDFVSPFSFFARCNWRLANSLLFFFWQGCTVRSSSTFWGKGKRTSLVFSCLIFMKIRRQRGNKKGGRETEGWVALKREGGQTRASESLYRPTKKNERKVSFSSSCPFSSFLSRIKGLPSRNAIGGKTKELSFPQENKERKTFFSPGEISVSFGPVDISVRRLFGKRRCVRRPARDWWCQRAPSQTEKKEKGGRGFAKRLRKDPD